MTAIAEQLDYSGGEWVDPSNTEFIPGTSPTGLGYGKCPTNCSEQDAAGFETFHVGRAHTFTVDGTIRFLCENIGVTVFQMLNIRSAEISSVRSDSPIGSLLSRRFTDDSLTA